MTNKIKKTVFALSLIALIAGLYVTITTGRYVNQETYLKNVFINTYINTLNQTIFLTLLCIYGYVLGHCFSDVLKTGYIVLLSPILAVTMWMYTGQIILSLGIVYNAFSSVAAMLIVLAVAIIIKKPKLKRVFDKNFMLTLFAYFSLSLLLSSVDFTLITIDSYTYIILGQSLAKNGRMLPSLAEFYSARSLFTPLMFTPSNFFGFDFENGLYTLYGLSFNVFLSYCIFDELDTKISKKRAFIVSALAFALLMFTNQYSLIMLINPYSNSLTTVALFCAILFVYKAVKEDIRFLPFSIFFMVAFIWIRTESIIIALLIMFFISNMDMPKKQIVKYELICLGALAFWYVTFFRVAGIDFNQGKFLTITRACEIIAVFAAFVVYTIFVDRLKFYNKVKNKLDVLPFAGLGLAIFAFAFIDSAKLIANAQIYFMNAVVAGNWGVTITILFGIFALYYYYSKDFDIWDKSFFIYIISLLFIFLFRSSNLRLGRTDSANRMLITIIPIFVFIVASRLPILLQNAFKHKKLN